MKSVVIGLGQFGYASALALAKSGAEVVAIDADEAIVDSIKEDVALAVATDASKRVNLEALDIADADVLIAAIGRNFEAQLLTVVYAKQLGLAKIVARAGTKTHAEILHAVGAHVVLNPEEDSARRLVRSLLLPNIQTYFELAEGFSLIEVNAPASTVGRSLKELDLRRSYRVNVVAVKHAVKGKDGEPAETRFEAVPNPESVIAEGDVLSVLGSDLDIAHFLSDVE